MNYLQKKRKPFEFIAFIVTASCIWVAVWATNIFRNTFMDWRILILPAIVGSVFFIIIFWRILIKIGYPLWAIIFISTTCGGCLTHFGFLYLNQRYANSDLVSNVFNIEKKGRLSKGKNGCEQPYAVISFNNLEKEIVFYCDFADKLQDCSKIKITYQTGFFGYEVIKEKVLIK